MRTKRKLERLTFSELETEMRCFEHDALRTIIGGGNGTSNNPYSWGDVDSMLDQGTWTGGYVNDGYETFYLQPMTLCTIYGSNNNGGSGGYLSNSILQTIAGEIANMFSTTLGKLFTAASIFDATRSFVDGEISDSVYVNRLLWIGFGTAAGGPICGAAAGLISYFSEVGGAYAQEKYNQLNYQLEEYFSNPIHFYQP